MSTETYGARDVVVAHCIPTGDSIEFDAFMSIARLLAEWPHIAPRSWKHKLCAGRGQPVSFNRTRIAKVAVSGSPLPAPMLITSHNVGEAMTYNARLTEKYGHYCVGADVAADVLVFQDTDVTVEPSDVIKLVRTLLDLPDDVGLLGVPCVIQEKVGRKVRVNVWEIPGDDPYERISGGAPFPIHAIGFGLVAIRASVFKVLEQPWFTFDQRPDGGMVGEDVGFCNALRLLGFQVWADPRISVTHSFRRGFAIDDTQLAALIALSKGGPVS